MTFCVFRGHARHSGTWSAMEVPDRSCAEPVTSSRPEVVSVQPIDEDTSRGCSRRALLQAQSTQSSRLTSIILAEDVVTGQALRCDAIVDVIYDVIIVSTARELYLEGSPLALEVNALDLEGNTFSTLAGVVFDWSLVKDVDVKGSSESSDLLRFLKFSESTYTPPGYITEMERVGKQGNIILVSGLKMGQAKVKAKIQDSLYHGVNATEVKLLIMENILLSPSHDVYLLVGASIQYQVLKIKQGLINELPMPCKQYELHLLNSVVDINGNPDVAVARLDQRTSMVTAIQLGYINVVLEDKNFRMKDTFRLLNSTLFVVEPAYLGFKIHPGDSWILETGREYNVIIEVFDTFSNKIYLSDNIRIDTVFHLDYFDNYHSSLNGSHHPRVQPLIGGRTVIEATLVAFEDDKGVVHPLATPIHNEQEVTIYYPIFLIPSSFIFPWHPQVGACQYTIETIGGSGNFSWSSSNTSVVTVTDKGVMKTGGDIGVSRIHVRDMRNPLHFENMEVYVIEPVAMDFAPCKVEARVGMILELPLRIYGLLEENEMMLSDCSHFDLKVNNKNQGVFELLEDRLFPGLGYCSGVGAKALAPGHTMLSVSYSHVNVHLNVHLSAEITIVAYLPLTAIDPVSVAVVTLGASKKMLFDGGPRPWILEPLTFFRDVKTEDEKRVGLTLTSSLSRNFDQYFVTATCKALGEQMLEMSVTNKASVTNPYPAIEWVSVKFVCTSPSRFTLFPVYAIPELERLCPLLQQNKYVVPVSNYRNTVLNLVAFDQKGRKFDNFSSLSIVWETNQVSLASIEPTLPMRLQLFEDENKQMKLHGRQIIVVHRQSGIAAITVTALDYQPSHLKAAEIHSQDDKFAPFSATLELKLIEDVNVFPDTLTIYNHPDVKVNLVLREGSGHFFVNTTAKDIAEVVLQDSKETAQVTPLQVGVAQVMVHDLCLAYTAEVTVYVSGILEVNLRMADKVGIGKSVRCYVRVLDDKKKPFSASYFQLMKLKVKAFTKLVSLIPIADSTEHNNTAVYLVKGVSVGQTTLYAAVVDKNENMLSAYQQIEVSPSFKLIPQKMTLLIGAMMQITSVGGTQPLSNILFSISNEGIASVNRIGHVKGLAIGNVIVTGLVQAVDPETGMLVIMSKHQIEVEVVHLTAIRISAPNTRIMTGMQMPVYVMGLSNSQTPFMFGNALPSLTFHWSTTKRDILDVESKHTMANVELNAEHNFGMSVTGRARGRTGLQVVLTVVDPVVGQLAGNLSELMDEIQIQVYEKTISVLNPKVEAGEILMTPHSVLKLQTNWDGVGALSYQMLKESDQVTVAQVDDKGFLLSGALFGISSLLITSQESFGVSQTLIITVKVVPVSYVRFSTSPALYTYTRRNVKDFPLGIVLILTVHFHTSAGELLHSCNSHLTFSTNRDDLVQVIPGQGHHTLTVRTVKSGLTLLSVHDSDNTVIVDYIPLPVAHAIQPAEAQTLVVGDVICFTAQLASQDGGHGTWSSSANAVLQVDSKTGAAVARHNGVATVYYEIPDVVKTFREIVVESATKTVAEKQSKSPVTIGNQIDVLLRTRGEGTNLIGICSSIQIEAIAQLQPETSVTCLISFTSEAVNFLASSVIKTHVSFNSSIGLYTCSLTLQPMAAYQAQELSMSMTNLLVKAGLEGTTFSGKQVWARLRIVPGLYTDLPALMLSNAIPSVEFTVFGPVSALADMEVVSSSPVIDIQEIEAQRDFPSFTKYTISVLDVRAAGLAYITINSASTGQELIISVNLIYTGDSGGDIQALVKVDAVLQTTYTKVWFALWSLVAGLAVLFIAVRKMFPPKQQRYPRTVDHVRAPS
ncbi:nuclear pore membrane glycoprotein 210-like isoform X2 [Festucalex cinctus]